MLLSSRQGQLMSYVRSLGCAGCDAILCTAGILRGCRLFLFWHLGLKHSGKLFWYNCMRFDVKSCLVPFSFKIKLTKDSAMKVIFKVV